MITLHAVERYMERVMGVPSPDRSYITKNFYGLCSLVKASYDEAILILEEPKEDDSSTIKYYIDENIVFIVDDKGNMVTIYTIDTNKPSRIKYLATINELKGNISAISEEINTLKSKLYGYQDIVRLGLVSVNSPVKQMIDETANIVSERELKRTALEVKLKFTAKALVRGRYYCNNRMIAELYREEIYKKNCLYNFESASYKKTEKYILED